MVARFLERVLLERVGGREVEMSGQSSFILWLSHDVSGGEAPGQGIVGAS